MGFRNWKKIPLGIIEMVGYTLLTPSVLGVVRVLPLFQEIARFHATFKLRKVKQR